MADTAYDDIRNAIKSAIADGDTDCPASLIHTYRRNPVNPQPDIVRELCEREVEGGWLIHFYDITRLDSSELEEEGRDDGEAAVTITELWQVRAWYSQRDSQASEVTFQKALDEVRASVRNHADIIQLINDWDILCTSVSINEISLGWIGSSLVHHAKLAIRFTHTGV